MEAILCLFGIQQTTLIALCVVSIQTRLNFGRYIPHSLERHLKKLSAMK